MRSYFIFWLALFGCLSIAAATPAASSSSLAITSPKSGEALQGVVSIVGTSSIPGFSSADLYFTYSSSQTSNWFLIQESTTPVTHAELASWDTTTLTDGTYDLKLVVNLTDSSYQEVLVKQVRIRNYTPIETSTPTLQSSQIVVESPPSFSPTAEKILVTKVLQTPTNLPDNPAELTQNDLLTGLKTAGLLVAGLFLLGLLYFGWIRRK